MRDVQTRLTPTAARDHAVRAAFGRLPDPDGAEPPGTDACEVPCCIGLEPEYFLVHVDRLGTPEGRPRLYGEDGVLEAFARHAEEAGEAHALFAPNPHLGREVAPFFDLVGGGRITFEPGGQVEHSTRVFPTAAEAMDDLERVREGIARIVAPLGWSLCTLGVDPWHDVADVPQQLPGGRYRAQAEFYDLRGPHGRTMMRNTTSVQVNFDLGPPGVDRERWLLTNLVSPLLTATFSTSPGAPPATNGGPRGPHGSGPSCLRALAWQGLDPTRTGFPAALEGDDRVLYGYGDLALDADVMLFRRAGAQQGMATGEPGFSFRRWIEEGHPEHGEATVEDLDYHLSTIFPEVRARGFLELRAVDGLPADLVAPFVVFMSGLVYDRRARREALELLGGHAARTPALWERAAQGGLRDSELAGLAAWLWPLALEGARRLPAGWFRAADLVAATAFLDRWVLEGHAPSEELRELLASTPSAALTWGR